MNTRKSRKLVKISEHSRQSEVVITKLVLKCIALAQARLVTSIGSILHMSIVISMAVLKVENKRIFQRQARVQQWANNVSRQK